MHGNHASLLIGWASKDVTPERPVLLYGQFHARASEGVLDPLTVTALALESVKDGKSAGQAVMVSCDCAGIHESLYADIKRLVKERLADFDPVNLVVNATHTHTAPDFSPVDPNSIGSLPASPGLRAEDLGVMARAEYSAFVTGRIVDAVEDAWKGRAPGGISFGLGHAVVGYNRRVSYFTGETKMYGNTNDREFSHIEGGEDHSVNLLCTWDKDQNLTGVVVNLACPSQVSENLFQVSADYWHETRLELRQRFGQGLFVLPQCSAAGDQSPHVQVEKRAEERMLKLAGRTQRQDIALRIADAVSAVVPVMKKDIDWAPALQHRVEEIDLPLRMLNEKDVSDALSEAGKAGVRYEALRKDLEAHPEKKKQARWYVDVTQAYCRMLWNKGVERRFLAQKSNPVQRVEAHVIRVGSAAFATNPFEYYLDFGLQIKARSKAVQTFVVQLAGGGVASYLPTVRATAGASYGALPASTPIGPDGGRILANRTLELIDEVMK